MSASTPPRRLSYAEYLVLEESSPERHEFFDGHMPAMAGCTGAHAALKTNLSLGVGGARRGRPCRARGVDQRIVIKETGLATCPDHRRVRLRREVRPLPPPDVAAAGGHRDSTRRPDQRWARQGFDGGSIPLGSVDVTLDFDELYVGWEEERRIDAGGG